MKIQPNGDQGIIVKFPGDVTPQLNERIQQFCLILEKASIPGVIELVPAYDSVTIYYNPAEILYQDIRGNVIDLIREPIHNNRVSNRLLHVPVLYGGEEGPDLERLARHAGLEQHEVIELHKAPRYLVYMLGFLPGFPYLGGLNSQLVIPRLKSPRGSVSAGSIGIAHEQTGIYPIDSPGGWNIIGRTPVNIFNPQKQEDAFLFQPGDYVQFYEVSKSEYQEIDMRIKKGAFEVEIERL